MLAVLADMPFFCLCHLGGLFLIFLGIFMANPGFSCFCFICSARYIIISRLSKRISPDYLRFNAFVNILITNGL